MIKSFNILKLCLMQICVISIFTSCNFKEEEETGEIFNHQTATNEFTMTTSSSKTYVENDYIYIYLTHSYTVDVSGIPSIAVNLDSSNENATYYSGSGSNVLVFRYLINANDEDLDGISVASTIDLNGGTMTFTKAGIIDNATTSFSTSDTSGILIDTTAPTVTTITPPTPQTYYVGKKLQFLITFSEKVEITGLPRIVIDVNGTDKYATYASGSGGKNILFEKTILASDLDTNGITITSPIDLNSGTIKDMAGNDADLTYTVSALVQASLDNTDLDGDTPYVVSITPPANNTYQSGDTVSFLMVFSEAVDVSGSPSADVTLTSGNIQFDYASGSGTNTLEFSYIITAGDYDLDGISLPTSIALNGGTIRDVDNNDAYQTMNAPLTPNVKIDALIPEVTSIDPPANGTYLMNNQIFFQVNFNTDVDVTGVPQIQLNIGGTLVYANYSDGSGTDQLIFSYVVPFGLEDLDGINVGLTLILNGGTIESVSSGTSLNPDLTTPVNSLNTTGVLIDSN